MLYTVNNTMLYLVVGDITKVTADAIVNAANSELAGGGGVDGAIHMAAGPMLDYYCQEERRNNGMVATGGAVITPAGNLDAQFVIHAVGPVYDRRPEMAQTNTALLKNAYENSLKLAEQAGCKTVAFPAISTGIYGYPKKLACLTALRTVLDHIRAGTEIEKITFVLFDRESYDFYAEALLDDWSEHME